MIENEISEGILRGKEPYRKFIYIKEFEMFKKNKDREVKLLLEGIEYKTLTFGERTSLSEFSILCDLWMFSIYN